MSIEFVNLVHNVDDIIKHVQALEHIRKSVAALSTDVAILRNEEIQSNIDAVKEQLHTLLEIPLYLRQLRASAVALQTYFSSHRGESDMQGLAQVIVSDEFSKLLHNIGDMMEQTAVLVTIKQSVTALSNKLEKVPILRRIIPNVLHINTYIDILLLIPKNLQHLTQSTEALQQHFLTHPPIADNEISTLFQSLQQNMEHVKDKMQALNAIVDLLTRLNENAAQLAGITQCNSHFSIHEALCRLESIMDKLTPTTSDRTGTFSSYPASP